MPLPPPRIIAQGFALAANRGKSADFGVLSNTDRD
jgi:hypothetical protein